MAISQYGNEYYGLSGDDKPIGTPLNGRKITEMDTSKEYRFDAENQQWLQQSGGGGGGGSSTLSGLTDVDISNPTDGQTLVYNATSGKWENGSGPSVSGPLIVNVVEGELETAYTYTCDKTVAEIMGAMERGVIFKYSSTSYVTCVGASQVMDGYIFYRGFTTNSDPQFAANGLNDYPSYVD